MAKNYHFSRKYFKVFPKRKTMPRYFHFLRSFSAFFLIMIRSTGEVYPPISTDGEIYPLFANLAKYIHFFPLKNTFPHQLRKRILIRFTLATYFHFGEVFPPIFGEIFPLFSDRKNVRNMSTFFLLKKRIHISSKTNFNQVLL